VTADELRRRRATAQLLHRPQGGSPDGVVRVLLAVQAQDRRAARLALRARTPGLGARDVEAALAAERRLAVTWLLRGTLHLVCAEDLPWLLGLTAPRQETTGRRRLGQLGVEPDDAQRAEAIIERALAAEGPLTRAELAGRLAARRIPTEGQAMPHLLALAARRGVAVMGPLRAGEPAYVLARDWLGAAPPAELSGEARDTALAELARRWLAGHGPARDADLAAWSGLSLRDARAGLRAIAEELVELDGGLVDLTGRKAAGPVAPRLLPGFDPYLLGWRDRGFAVPAAHARRVHPGGGILRATATADGRVVGTWKARRRGGRLTVELEPFVCLRPGEADALAAEARDVERFEAGARA
jgi:hypothetical protein